MTDFLAWFFVKHFVIAAILFPELALCFAVWQRWAAWSAALAVWVVGHRVFRVWREFRTALENAVR